MSSRAREPALRIRRRLPVRPVRALGARRVDDSGDVAGRGQNEADVAAREETNGLEARTPRRYVVLLRRQHVQVGRDRRRVEPRSVQLELSACELVVDVARAEVEGVEGRRE